MNATECYRTQGYFVLPGFLANDIAKAIADQVMQDALTGGATLGIRTTSPILRRNTFQVNSSQYVPLRTLLWGLTPTIARLVGQDIAPTNCFFRVYGKDDICHVHADTPSCEHSVSLMLSSEGDAPWSLEMAKEPTPLASLPAREDFDGAGYVSTPMKPGDAILYQGITRRHGRMTPNPNNWSAHLFLHWVSRGGPYEDRSTIGSQPIARRGGADGGK